MDFRKLEAFGKVYELRSFSKAGQELFLSQPTISAHVADLENELGVRLFDRLGRSTVPTQAGEVLYKSAEKIFQGLDRAKAEIDQLRGEVAGELCVGGSTVPAHYILPKLFSGFALQHPGVSLKLTVADSSSVSELVAKGKLSLAMVGAEPSHPALAAEPIVRDTLQMVATPQLLDRLGRPKGLEDLVKLPWVVRDAGSGTRRTLERALRQQGLNPRRLHVSAVVEGSLTALECALAGVGATVVSCLAAQEAVAAGRLEVINVGLDLRRDFLLIYHQERELFPVERGFLEQVRENAAKLACMDTGGL